MYFFFGRFYAHWFDDAASLALPALKSLTGNGVASRGWSRAMPFSSLRGFSSTPRDDGNGLEMTGRHDSFDFVCCQELSEDASFV